MEHAQRDGNKECDDYELVRLNPYFNGTCSKSGFNDTDIDGNYIVS